MARSLAAGMVTAITDTLVRPFIAFELELDDETLRYWGGFGTLSINGNDYLGSGAAIMMGPVQETVESKATGTSFQLSGVPASLIATVFDEQTQGRPVRTWFGCFDANGAIIVSPFKLFEGFLDVPEIDEQGDSAIITCSAESEAITQERRRERRHTAEDQQLDYPGDKAFEFVPGLQDIEITRRG